MSEHPLNTEIQNYEQWATLIQELNTLRAKLAQAESERDAARQAAARYKRRAEAVYRYWCSYWGALSDWGMLRVALYEANEASND